MLVGNGLHTDEITKWTVHFTEDLVEHEILQGPPGILYTRAHL